MKSAFLIALTCVLLQGSEVASIDAFGQLSALFYRGETLSVSSNVNVVANGRDVGLASTDRLTVERTPDGGTWRGSLNGFAFVERVGGRKIQVEMVAEQDFADASIDFHIGLPRAAFVGGIINGQVRLTPERPTGPHVFDATTSRYEVLNGPLRFSAVFDRERGLFVDDVWLRQGRWYFAAVQLHRGPIAKDARITFETTLEVNGTPDTSRAQLTLDASRVRYRLHGFGGNYCFNTDSPVAAYTLKDLRSAWARVEMNSREWEPENDDASPSTTNWSVFKTRDVDGSKLHRDLLLARQIQDKNIPYVISVWRLPEWLYSDPDQQPSSAHRRRVPPEKWEELLEHIGSYLTYAKVQYGVEPDLFSFNEANIGVNVIFTAQEHREAIKSIGAHLRKLGLKTKMLLGDATGPRNTHEWALAAAHDPEALQFVGAVAFHSWDGGTPAQYGAWGDLAEWLKLPLLVAEVGVDAFAWRNRTYDTFHYGMREVEMYQELLLYARPQGFMQWEYTGDYGLASVVKNGRGAVEVRPSQRFWFLKQFSDLTPMHSEALETLSNHARVLFTAFSGVEEGRRTYAMHVANLGAAREITITGIPVSVKAVRVVRTSETESMREVGRVDVTDGAATLRIPERCLVTLTASE